MKKYVEDISNIIIKCYHEILFREPDEAGLKSFVKKIKNKEITKEQLPEIFKKSEEYKKIIKNNEKILKQRKKILCDFHKIRKVKYGEIQVNHKDILDGGGQTLGQDFIPTIKKIFGKVSRICDFGAGSGHIGFSLLSQGLCDSLCLIDVNPDAVEMCKKTIKENKLENKVSVYLSDGLSNIPLKEKWDLVVSNPPHFSSIEANYSPDGLLRVLDPNWKIHQNFYANVNKFLNPEASILFQEQIFGGIPAIHTQMILKNDLEVVDIFWYKKFNGPRDVFWKFKSHKQLGKIQYIKKISKGLVKPEPYPFYFIWSKKKKEDHKR